MSKQCESATTHSDNERYYIKWKNMKTPKNTQPILISKYMSEPQNIWHKLYVLSINPTHFNEEISIYKKTGICTKILVIR